MAEEDPSAEAPPESTGLEVGYARLRAPPALVAALGAPIFAALAFLFFVAPGTVTLMGAAMAAGALAYFARRMPVARGSLDIAGDDVRFGGERLLSRADLSAAVVIPSAGEARVELRSLKRVLATLHLANEADARRLVDRLGFGPGSRIVAVEIPGSPWLRALALAVALGAAAVGASEIAALASVQLAVLWAAFCMLAGVIAQPLTRQVVEVGADGVRLTSRGRERFVAFSEIQSVTASRGAIASLRLRLTSGASIRLELASRPGANQGLAAGLADLIRQAKARAGETSTVGARLGRRGREPRTWLSDLRALGAGADADHRRAPATDDVLWDAVTSPDSAGVERAAAAVALAGDPGRRADLLRIADSVAAPRVRIAIARAAEAADDEALAEALLEIERHENKARRAR